MTTDLDSIKFNIIKEIMEMKKEQNYVPIQKAEFFKLSQEIGIE
ncbi:MAG TPA: hypothetical protein VJ953_15385 [Saprospiraceae bacterium]|nr:hypothetical protein [Saprospiraceae bacterium]